MLGKPIFVPLGSVLSAVGSRFVIPDGAKLHQFESEPWKLQVSEQYARTSGAAAVLDHVLSTADEALSVRWFDYREGTGYPRSADSARVKEGVAFLLEEGRWYWRWKEFQRNFHARRLSVGGRFHIPASDEEYVRDCPRRPIESERFAMLIHELCFELDEIVAFLDKAGVSHSLVKRRSPDETAGATGLDTRVRTLLQYDTANDKGGDQPPSEVRIECNASEAVLQTGRRYNEQAKGRQCAIKRELQEAQRRAAERGQSPDEFEVVREILLNMAKEKWGRLEDYNQDGFIYKDVARKRTYTYEALRKYFSRRSRRDVPACATSPMKEGRTIEDDGGQ